MIKANSAQRKTLGRVTRHTKAKPGVFIEPASLWNPTEQID